MICIERRLYQDASSGLVACSSSRLLEESILAAIVG